MHSGAQTIGGVFGLGDPLSAEQIVPHFLGDRSILLANARSGLWLAIRQLAPAQVWLPSYLCTDILAATDHPATHVRFYPVDGALRIPWLEWTGEVQRGDLALLIDYFGFPCDMACAAALQKRGAWIIEDACQALLSAYRRDLADVVLFSPRKFLGVPDGGILDDRSGLMRAPIELSDPPAAWWLTSFAATLNRRVYDTCGGDRGWFDLFQRAEATIPRGAHAMSQLTRLLLENFDYEAVARRRVANYQRLLGRLEGLALFPELPADVVPLGFPIRVKNRDAVRTWLFTQMIFPPIHWRLEGHVPEKFTHSHQLAAEIMTLPCDQRYGEPDMDRMAEMVLQVAER
jgi:hypothetical protein